MCSCCCMYSTCPKARQLNPFGCSGTPTFGEGTQLVETTTGEEIDLTEVVERRTEMDIALLRERYKSTKEKQMRQTQVLMFRRVSEDISDALRVVPVTQGLSSLWETNKEAHNVRPLAVDPTLTTPDPWHVHLDLYHRSCINGAAGVTVPISPPVTMTNFDGSFASSISRRTSSLSETGDYETTSRLESHAVVDSTAGLNCSYNDLPPGSSHITIKEDQLTRCVNSPQTDHLCFNTSKEERFTGSFKSTYGCSFTGSINHSKDDSLHDSLGGFDESSSTPVGSTTASVCSSEADLNGIEEYDNPLEGRSGGRSPVLRQLSAPAPTLTRQLSCWGPQHPPAQPPGPHHPNYYPFPNRKTLKKSEAAKRLGMYSSF